MRRDNMFRWATPTAAICVVVFLASSIDAAAISRYNTTSLSCSSIKSKIRSQGAVILRWTSKSGNPNYNRFVRNASFCNPGQTTTSKTVPSASGNCRVPYCVSRRALDPFD